MHEKAIEAACDRLILVQGMTTHQMRAAIAAFLRAVEPSEEMGKAAYDATEDGYGVTAAQDAWRAMSRALAEEIDNAQG